MLWIPGRSLEDSRGRIPASKAGEEDVEAETLAVFTDDVDYVYASRVSLYLASVCSVLSAIISK